MTQPPRLLGTLVDAAGCLLSFSENPDGWKGPPSSSKGGRVRLLDQTGLSVGFLAVRDPFATLPHHPRRNLSRPHSMTARCALSNLTLSSDRRPSRPGTLIKAMITPIPFIRLAATILLCSPAFSQVADDCSFADTFSGSVTINFDTRDCFDNGGRAFTGSPQTGVCTTANNDVWVRFIPTVTGVVRVETCDSADFDTVLAVYNSGGLCAGTIIACNDDGSGCSGGSSELNFIGTAGVLYHIQLGAKDPSVLGSGSLRITELSGPTYPANNTCSGALTIAPGDTDFDTTGTSSSPVSWPCGGTGGLDLWYTYIATETALAQASTCGSSFDTKLAVYEGTCNLQAFVACDDNTCGSGSVVTWSAVAGRQYQIRVSGVGVETGTGTLTLSDGSPRLNPANGHYYAFFPDSGIPWDAARSLAASSTYMGSPGHLATITSESEQSFLYDAFPQISNYWIGGLQNLSSPTYSEPSGGWEWITGEPWTYTNWSPGEPNNSGNAEGFLVLRNFSGTGMRWNDDRASSGLSGYVVEYDDVTFGTNYCQATPNSTGVPSTTRSFGSNSVAANAFSLRTTSLPLNQFGFYVASRNQGLAPNPGGSAGILCLGGSISRLDEFPQILSSGQSGEVSLSLSLQGIPAPSGPVDVVAGETWNFQLWHRDVFNQFATSNFSDGLSVQFVP